MAVHRSADSFIRAMNRRVADVEANARRITRVAVVRAAAAVFNVTPQDTGHLASQWRLVEAGQRPEVDPRADASPAAVRAAFAEIERAAATVRLGDNVELANAVGYAVERAKLAPMVGLHAVALWLDSQKLLGP